LIPRSHRPIEIRNLFNPAFCGLLLFRSFQAFEKTDPNGMYYSTSLLVLPLSLHMPTREILLTHPKTHLLKMIEDHPEVLIGFADRASDMFPYSQEAFSLLMNYSCLDVSDRGRITTRHRKVKSVIASTDEIEECLQVAKKLGREFAKIADRATIYTSFGVKP
jgi:hypothetical protein